MKAGDIIKNARTYLKDDKPNKYSFSDEFLLNILNQEHNFLLQEFNQGISLFTKKLTQKDFILPMSSLKILNAFLNGKKLDLQSFNYALETHKNSTGIKLVSLNMQNFSIEPYSEGILEIYYIPAMPIQNLEETLILEDIFFTLLTLRVILQALKLETNERNLEKVRFYSQENQKETQRVINLLNQSIAKNTTQTPYKIV